MSIYILNHFKNIERLCSHFWRQWQVILHLEALHENPEVITLLLDEIH